MNPQESGPAILGTAIAGYKLIEEIARGSAGVVYRAKQLSLDRTVALKVLISGGHASEQEVARFYAEAQAVAKLRHPNIVPVFDVGRFSESHFIAMEYVDGEPLDAALRDRKFTSEEALDIIGAVAAALECAHTAGIVHRDVKPANIMLGTDGGVRVMDFGLAKQLESDIDLTRSGTTVGTPNYMSPEQARGDNKNVGAQSDLYSLGAILYELLTGRPPHTDESNLRVLLKVASEDPVPPRRLNPQVQKDLQTICLKAMEKNQARRYPTAHALAEDLRRFQAGEPILARPASVAYKLSKKLARHWRSTAVLLLAVATTVVLVSIVEQNRASTLLDRKDKRITGPNVPPPALTAITVFEENFDRNLEANWRVLRGDLSAWKIADQVLTVRTKEQTWIEASPTFRGDARIQFSIWNNSQAGGIFAVFFGGEGENRKGSFRAQFHLSEDGRTVSRIGLYYDSPKPLGETHAALPIRLRAEDTHAHFVLERVDDRLTVRVGEKPILSVKHPKVRTAKGNFGFGAIQTSWLLLDKVRVQRLLPAYDTLQDRAERALQQRRYTAARDDYTDLLDHYAQQEDPVQQQRTTYLLSYSALGALGLFEKEAQLNGARAKGIIDRLQTIADHYNPDRQEETRGWRPVALDADTLIGTCQFRLGAFDNLYPLRRQIEVIVTKYQMHPAEVLERIFQRPMPEDLIEDFWNRLVNTEESLASDAQLYIAAMHRDILKAEDEGHYVTAAQQALKLAGFYLEQAHKLPPDAKIDPTEQALAVLQQAITLQSHQGFPVELVGRLKNRKGDALLKQLDFHKAEAIFTQVRDGLREEAKRRIDAGEGAEAEYLTAAEADLGLATVANLGQSQDQVIQSIQNALSFPILVKEPIFPEPEPPRPQGMTNPPSTPEEEGIWLEYNAKREAWQKRQQRWMAQPEHEAAILKCARFKVRYEEIRRRMLYMLSEAYRKKGEYDKAVAPLKQLAEDNHELRAERARAWRVIGDVLRYGTRYEEAHRAYWETLKNSVEQRTECAVARIRLGETLLLLQDYPGAEEQFAQLEIPWYQKEFTLRMDARNKRGLALALQAGQPDLPERECEQLRDQAEALWRGLQTDFPSVSGSDPNVWIAEMMSSEEPNALSNDLFSRDPKERSRLNAWMGIRSELDDDRVNAKASYQKVLQNNPLGLAWHTVWARKRFQEVTRDPHHR